MDDYYTNEIDYSLLTQIEELFFANHKIGFNENVEGQNLDDDGNFLLGLTIGPTKSVNGVLHEMAHFAELPIKRLIAKPSSGWGFTYGKYWEVYNSSGYEPQTDQSVQREIRTWAYQNSINVELGLNIPVLDLVSSSTYLHAFSLYKCNVVTEQERDELGYQKADQLAIVRMAEQVEDLSKNRFTFDDFWMNWESKLEILDKS